MPIYKQESLESLRNRIDINEVLSPYVELKPAGAVYKGLCPFHDEKTPSFTVQRGSNHYHCFGCSAHGDAIAFLMEYQRMTFVEAVESLAQRFGIHLEYEDRDETDSGISKKNLHEALDQACRFYHFCLLYTEEGHEALHYLYKRGIDLDFIKEFKLGLAPKSPGIFRSVMREKKVTDVSLLQAGLIKEREGGGYRDFFYDRITIPIQSPSGAIIGFTARKYKEETFGGKYVNSTETPVFKKSHVLFGLNYSRRKIAKEHRAIIVEGQLDALRLIKEGFDITVAGQGTAFGEGHVQLLTRLGVEQVFLALDSDSAGREAAIKIGNLFQREGVEVYIVEMPQGSDPDSFIREQGPDLFLDLIKGGVDYLTFLVRAFSMQVDMNSPAGKNSVIKRISEQVRTWSDEVMVHESLRKLAHLTQVPEEMIGVSMVRSASVYVKQSDSIAAITGSSNIDPNQILEGDLLHWLLLSGKSYSRFLQWVGMNVRPTDFKNQSCQKIYEALIENTDAEKGCKLLDLAAHLSSKEQELMNALMDKKINRAHAEENLTATLKKILERNWLAKREALMIKIQSGEVSGEEEMTLLREYSQMAQTPPQVKMLEMVSTEEGSK